MSTHLALIASKFMFTRDWNQLLACFSRLYHRSLICLFFQPLPSVTDMFFPPLPSCFPVFTIRYCFFCSAYHRWLTFHLLARMFFCPCHKLDVFCNSLSFITPNRPPHKYIPIQTTSYYAFKLASFNSFESKISFEISNTYKRIHNWQTFLKRVYSARHITNTINQNFGYLRAPDTSHVPSRQVPNGFRVHGSVTRTLGQAPEIQLTRT